MAIGFAINIAMRSTDPAAYPSWQSVHDFPFADQDIADIESLQTNFTNVTKLVGADATAQNILNAVVEARDRMNADDLLLVSYAGHGGFIPDENGLWSPERSFKAWAVYDRFLLAGEVLALWRTFAPGRKILLVSDSCYCGYLFSSYPPLVRPTDTPLDPGETPATIKARAAKGPLVPDNNWLNPLAAGLGNDLPSVFNDDDASPAPAPGAAPPALPKYRAVPNPSIAELLPEYQRLKTTYDRIRAGIESASDTRTPIPVVALLACSGDEEAGGVEGSSDPANPRPARSLFTWKLRTAVEIERQPNYGRLIRSVQDQIVDYMVETRNCYPQWPQLGLRGPKDELAAFVKSQPFVP